MEPVRKVQKATHFKKTSDGKYTPCSPGDPRAEEKSWTELSGDQLKEPMVDMNMMLKALKNTRPTVNQSDLERIDEWTRDFGMEG